MVKASHAGNCLGKCCVVPIFNNGRKNVGSGSFLVVGVCGCGWLCMCFIGIRQAAYEEEEEEEGEEWVNG